MIKIYFVAGYTSSFIVSEFFFVEAHFVQEWNKPDLGIPLCCLTILELSLLKEKICKVDDYSNR